MCLLKSFSWFEMHFYVYYRLVSESFAFVNTCVEECSICVRYFSRKLDGGPGGGGLPYESDGDARRKIRIKPLKETNLGVVQALFDP